MTELDLLSGAGTTAATAVADALVVGVLPARADADGEKGSPRLAPGAAAVDAAFDGELAALLALAGATGRADEVVRIPTRGTVTAPLVVAVGLGPAGDDGPSAEQVRRASGSARSEQRRGAGVTELARSPFNTARSGTASTSAREEAL